MINFLHNFLPQPILFQLGFLKIHWYGVFIVLAIAGGLFVVLKLGKRVSISADEIFDLGFYAIIFSLIGARVYAVFLELNFYLKNPFEIIAVWHGGLAIHGAIIGGVLAVWFYTHPLTRLLKQKSSYPNPLLRGGEGKRGRKERQSFWLFADLVAPALALGQAVGRWGNYFNQELFGGPTSLPWGIPIAWQNRPAEFLNYQYFQPTFLYESILNLFNFAILLFLFLRFCHPELVSGSSEMPNQARHDKKRGLVFLVYLINYSLIRIAMELLRQDPTPEIFGLRLPIVVSLGVIITSVVVLLFRLNMFKIFDKKLFKE